MFFYLYSICAIVIYIAALPFLSLFSFKNKYKISIPARFFLRKNTALKPDGIWFHSCSFGEARAIKPLVDALPKEVLRMSTTTQTGKSVNDTYTEQSRYLPFEPLLFGWMKPQKVLVVMEAEFWYLLFALARKKGAKTVLINARMSDRSFPKYQRIGWLYRQIFRHIDMVYAQTPLDKERLEMLGAKQVTVTGNIKLAALPKVTKKIVKPSGLLVCAASTHEGEEEVILKAFSVFKKEEPSARLIMVPRHPERFEQVASRVSVFAKENGYSWHRYSQKEMLESDITVIDRLGELVNLYAVSDIVILGGSFVPVGGHNAAEAAQFGCKIISGPYYFNQRDIFEAVEGIAVAESFDLARRLQQHGQLKASSVKIKSDLTPLLDTLNSVLKEKEADA